MRTAEPERRMREPLVVKIGGSLVSGERLSVVASIIARARRPLVVVPGGGIFADAVRDAQARHGTSDRAAHAMAILAMHQTGMLLEDMQPRFCAVETLVAIRQAQAAGRIPVWMPLRLSLADAQIPADWSITSDGLAARLAERLGLEGVLLVKSRRVPRGPGAAELARDGIVDPCFADIVARTGLSFRIVGPGDEREIADICCATTSVLAGVIRRAGGRGERGRRSGRRAAGGSQAAPRG